MSLPVDPERLRRQFPALTEEDLAAYVEVTRRVLADPQAKGKAMRAILESGRAARTKPAASLSADERLHLRYLAAVDKMQARVS